MSAFPATSDSSVSSLAMWIRLLRPVQWSKNAVLFAGAVFGAIIFEWDSFLLALLAFISFCLLSSAIYLVNDVVDAPADRVHPTKRERPVASERISTTSALGVATVLAASGLAIALVVNWWFLLISASYLVLMIAYCLVLKEWVIIDVFAIATGFVLRALGGVAAVEVPISPWLLYCAGILALFLGFCKRRNELAELTEESRLYRKTLSGYTIPLLDQAITITATATIMAYSMYTFTSSEVPDNDIMMITIPFVAFAMFRYLFLVYVRRLGGTPEALLWRDIPLLLSIAGWGITVVLVALFR